MRKFVIKNRQKRKYTRKTEEISSFSFSKTAYNMLPLLVMLIAFMSTMIISAPIRDAFTNISFTFELPKFSFTNPLGFFQTLATDLSQFGAVVVSILQSFAGALSKSFITTGNYMTSITFLLISFVLFCSAMISSFSMLILQEFIKGISLLGQFISFISTAIVMIFRGFFSYAAALAITTGEFIATETQLVTQQTIVVLNILSHFLLVAAVATWNFIVFIITTIINVLISAVTYIGALISHIFLAIVHVIEIPFKVLYAFWLLIKPYVDIFGHHVQMSGSDFSNMFDSISKIAALTSRAK